MTGPATDRPILIGVATPAMVLCGLGTALPDTVVSNEQLCQNMDVTPEWIRTRSGVMYRHHAGPGVTTADLAAQAGAAALHSSGHSTVDAVILATITPDRRCPATAPEVAARLGLAGVPAFDVAAACPGLLYAAQAAGGFLAAGATGRVLVIAADRITHLTGPHDPKTRPFFGDAAAAAVLRAGTPGEPGALGPIVLGADGNHADTITAPHTAYLTMRGAEAAQHAIVHMTQAAEQALAAAGWAHDEVDLFVPHQANARVTDAVGRRLGVAPARVVHHIDRVGNTSAASIPLALAHASAASVLRPGHRVLVTAFGAGLTWGATTLTWPDLGCAGPAAHKPSPTGDTVMNQLVHEVLTGLGLDPAGLTPDARLENVGVDSVALAEVAAGVKTHYGLDIPAEDLAAVRTVAELDTLVDAHRPASCAS
jgi:3-oxoacyl-[acyl-carrier-protein] synthase III